MCSSDLTMPMKIIDYVKKKRADRTVGQMVKAKLYSQKHTQKHTHTHSQKEKKGKKKIYIYISLLPKSTSSIWDDSLSIQVFH